MVAHTALAILAVVAMLGTGGAYAAGAFNMSSGSNLDLGTLTAGQTGTASSTTSIHVANATTYKFEMEMEDRIGSTFSHFGVTVSVNGNTYNLSGERNDSLINLSAGTSTFTIHLSYTVRDHVSSVNKTDIAFLYLHPIEKDLNQNNSGDHNQTGDLNTGNTGVQGAGSLLADGSSHSNGESNSSQHIALFSLTFQVSGNVGQGSDDQSSDSSRGESQQISS